jgi:outer membrane usher protein
MLGRSTLDLHGRRRPDGLSRRDAPSAFLNLGGRADDWERSSASGELGLSAGPGLLLSTATWSSTFGVERGLTVAHYDDAERRVRYAAGERFVSSTDPLGGSVLLAGLSAGREFSLDPYVIRDPYPRTSLFVPTPSTLEVWLGDRLLRRTQVAPGTLDIENLPLYSGMNEVRTVLRDAFGREQTASSFFLMGTNLLSPGLSDWELAAGFVRSTDADRSVDYGPAVTTARYRRGINRVVTLGARAEASPEVVDVGASAGLATRLGDLEAAVAASRAAWSGGAASLTWRARPFSKATIAAQLRVLSDRYANVSLLPAADRAVLRGQLSGSVSPIPQLSIMADLSAWRQRDLGDGLRASLRTAWNVGRGRQLSVSGSVGRMEGQASAWDVVLSWAMQLPGTQSLDVGATSGSAGESGWASLTRPLGSEPGVGYGVVGRVGDGSVAAVDLTGQAEFVRAAFTERWVDPLTGDRSNHEAVEASTGLVLIDGGLHLTRPLEASYALVVLEGAPNVRVTRDGQPVGRTDGEGRIFVPDLLPYYGNRLAIRDADLPIDFKVNEVERYVAPRHRAGTVERFDVGPVIVIVGRLVLSVDERDVAPEWGEIAVELPTGRVVSPIGDGGEFWLEGMSAGRHEALVRWEGRLCRFTLEVAAKPGIVDVGQQRCTQMLAVGGDAEGSPSGG